MSGTDTTGPGGTLINFPRLGFNLTPTTDLPAPPNQPPTVPAQQSSTLSVRPGRRSPLDAVAALPSPSLTAPVIPTVRPGAVTDTFRSEGALAVRDHTGARLGSLSLAAILATAVAALNGTHTVLSTWWEHRQARHAETEKLREARLKNRLSAEEKSGKHSLTMQGLQDKAAQQRAKKQVPSSAEFGRKAVGGGGRSGGSASSGGGKPSGRSAAGRSSTGSGSTGSKGKPSAGPARTSAGGKKPSGGLGPGSKQSASKQSGSKSGLNQGKGKTTRSPGNGKSPRSSASSPSMERARARQDAKTKRHADRQAARLDNRAKDRDAARARKNTVKDARQAAKTKAGEARAEQKQAKKDTASAAGDGRTTLAGAMRKTAERRLKKRRKRITPVIGKTKKPKTSGSSKGSKAGNSKGGSAGKPQAPAGKTNTNQKAPKATKNPKVKKSQGRWAKARAYARKKATRGGCFGRRTSTPGPTAPGTPGGTGPAPSGTPGSTPGGTTGSGGAHGTRTRRSPFQHAGNAGSDQAVWTTERADYPGAQAKRWEPQAITTGQDTTSQDTLDPDPTPHTQQPTTPHPPAAAPTPTAPRKEPRPMAAHPTIRPGGHRMSEEHATEITLDDSLDEADQFSQDAFKTHDQCDGLAKKAHALRIACIQLSEELATRHNLIGRLFQAALARFAESMDLVDRMSQEMQMSSLEAAEFAEALSNDLNDAYRPYTQATADAGLTTPSAPIHNKS